MTDTTKWVDRAVNEMIVEDSERDDFHCDLCKRAFTSAGWTARHIKKMHKVELHNRISTMEEEHDANRLKFEKEYFFKAVPRKIKDLKEEIDGIVKGIQTDPYNPYYVESLFDHRRCEILIMDVEKIAVLEQLQKYIDEAGKDFTLIRNEIIRIASILTEEVINGFPEHNSTNELSNFHARIKKAAWADLVKKRYGYGFLGELKRACNDIIKLQEKLQ